ncbi:MAG TPA: carbamoyltransferase [Chitinophaga sp.]
MAEYILGISAFYHDSAAALIADGQVLAAAQEERFSRRKHDASFPVQAIAYVLKEAGITYNDLSAIAFYDKPLLKFERLLETFHALAPAGLTGFLMAMPVWLREKLFIKKHLRKLGRQKGSRHQWPIYFPEHHLSHAASAFYPSPFGEAAILTIDGVGEWATTTICHGHGRHIKILKELRFPHSIGLLYSAFTYYLGFKVNSGEYKLMGLAPYGQKGARQTVVFRQQILSELVDLREDGSILLNMRYFNFATGKTMTNDHLWERLFGLHRRMPEAGITQAHMNLALAIQEVTEMIVLALARTARQITQSRQLVIAGGVGLNCVANSRLALAGIFDDIWVQPAAGDAGGALGAALAAYHIGHGQERKIISGQDAMKGAFLGPAYNSSDIEQLIDRYGAVSEYINEEELLAAKVSTLLAKGKVVGWFQGRMEFGPRALGNRSILADPRHPDMQLRLNGDIKRREGFRPFAPSVLEEDAPCYFELADASPYMLRVAPLRQFLRKPLPQRSVVPAITHVDYSARIQTVNQSLHPRFWRLIHSFKERTGYGMLVNTSFNVRGEPVVCTPEDAWQAFMHTGMDYLVMDNYLFDRAQQSFPQDIVARDFDPD